MNSGKKISGMGHPLAHRLKYAAHCLPAYAWQRLTRSIPRGKTHLVITLADHFEPSSIPGFLSGHAPKDVQKKRMDDWCDRYPRAFGQFRDSDGRTFNHTYF